MSSGATVPVAPAVISPIGVVVGKPVRAQQWRAAAELSNHVLGRGHTVIPSSSIDQAFAATGAKVYLVFKIMQTIQANPALRAPLLTHVKTLAGAASPRPQRGLFSGVMQTQATPLRGAVAGKIGALGEAAAAFAMGAAG